MRVEIQSGKMHPKVIWPGVEKNRSRFLTMVETIQAVPVVVATRQHDTFQSFREAVPFWNDVDKPLHVPLGDNMTKPSPWRLTVKDVTIVAGWSMTVLSLDAPIFHFGRRASVKSRLHHGRVTVAL